MKPKQILIFVFSLWSVFLPAQQHQVISTAGGSFENSSGSISFTVGECIIATHSSNDIIITQGFQQAKLTIVNIPDLKFFDFEISAYPNPVKDFVILRIEKPQGFTYKICDMSGRIIKIGNILSTESEISFSDLSPSIYIIKLYRSEEEIEAFKIIKR